MNIPINGSSCFGKNYLIMSEIISRYLPRFVNDPEYTKRALLYAETDFQVTTLLEEVMAFLSTSYTHLKGQENKNKDFTDKSDAKTGTIYDKLYNLNVYRGKIWVNGNGGQKEGALRIVIYNTPFNKLMYYYLPKRVWDHPKKPLIYNDGTIRFTYNGERDEIPKFENYRCKDFVELVHRSK